ncbi:hypothetical protein TNCV_3336561 [Trichonephila clavipes]|nr:hypothetical protein TNCV_3336561 [Trichonephila clavipes]
MVMNQWSASVESRFRVLVLPCRGLIQVKSCEPQSPNVGVMCKFGEGLPFQMSSSSTDHGSELRGPSSKALVLFQSVT